MGFAIFQRPLRGALSGTAKGVSAAESALLAGSDTIVGRESMI